MNEAKPVHITFLLDRSGSMSDLHADVVGGFNAYVLSQKLQPGKARLTLVQFDTNSTDVVHNAVRIADVPEMAPADFAPRGGTPLLDAVGNTINRIQARIDQRRAEGKREEVVLVVVYTDGQENSSREFTKPAIKALVETKTAQGWSFAYMGSDLAAYDEAGAMGFTRANTSGFASTSKGTHAAYSSVDAATSNLRSAANAGATPDAADFYQGAKAEDEKVETPSK